MEIRTDLNLGEGVCISIIYHIPDSWLFLVVAIFTFDGVAVKTSNNGKTGG